MDRLEARFSASTRNIYPSPRVNVFSHWEFFGQRMLGVYGVFGLVVSDAHDCKGVLRCNYLPVDKDLFSGK